MTSQWLISKIHSTFSANQKRDTDSELIQMNNYSDNYAPCAIIK